MIKIENKVSSVTCDICNKSCVVDDLDISVYEYSTFVKVNGQSLNFCGVCTEQIQALIDKLKTSDYFI